MFIGEPVIVNVPADGSYISAVPPPAKRTVPVGEHGRSVPGTSRRHIRPGTECPAGRIERSRCLMKPNRRPYRLRSGRAVSQESRGVTGTGRTEASRRRRCSGRGIEYLGGTRIVATRNEHPAVGEPRRGVTASCRRKGVGIFK